VSTRLAWTAGVASEFIALETIAPGLGVMHDIRTALVREDAVDQVTVDACIKLVQALSDLAPGEGRVRGQEVDGTLEDPLRPFTGSERRALEQLARSNSAPALSVARARTLLAVSRGSSCTQAAQLVGRTVGDSIAQWVTLFNQVGLRRWNGSLVVDHQPSTVRRSAPASVVRCVSVSRRAGCPGGEL
jgi:hypothetical protein